jgi:hypothetical protein
MAKKDPRSQERRRLKEGPKPVDLRRLRTYSIADRRELVEAKQLGKPTEPAQGVAAFLRGLPDILAARSLKKVARAICRARREEKPVVMALGAHVIKCGLSPFLIDLMQRGYITGLAMNGAGPIHDFELALKGATSEDVAAALEDGSFGMARETAEAIGRAAQNAARQGIGLGRAVGQWINARRLPHREISLLAQAAQLGLPATVHVAIGTDTVHMHPCVSPAQIAQASHLDFRILCDIVSQLEGGVWLNVGSAVVLPEVFLKALTVVRNLGHPVRDFTAVDLDMIRHYRPRVNVLTRPGGRAYAIIGHHELMIPLLRMMVLVEDKATSAGVGRAGS